MENRAHALLAGLFVLVMTLALVAALSWFQGDRTTRLRYTVVTSNSVTGLNLKAPVKLRGVDIGKVDTIRFDPADPSRILVDILVDDSAPLTRGTYAQLAFQGVTGLQFVALSDDGADRRPLRTTDGSPSPRIAMRPTLLDDLASAAPRLVGDASEGVRRVNAVLSDDNRARIDDALATLASSLRQLSQVLVELRPAAAGLPALVRDADRAASGIASLSSRADGTLGAVEGALGSLDRTLGRIDAVATEAGGLAAELRTRAAVLDQVGRAAAQIETSTARIDAALAGPDPEAGPPLIEQAGGLSARLNQTVDLLAEQPQSLVFGRPAPAPGPGESGFGARLKGSP